MSLSYLENLLSSENYLELCNLKTEIEKRFPFAHGRQEKLNELIATLPTCPPMNFSVNENGVICINDVEHFFRPNQLEQLEPIARKLYPWKKGPFKLFDLFIDGEWLSNLKWDRLLPHLPDLKGKRLLDIGCNNGYYLFRALEHQPELALGIDPVYLVYAQYLFFAHFIQSSNVRMEPFGVAEVKYFHNVFDVIFHMGIVYHHKNPIELLIDAKKALKKDGVLFLETIGIGGEESMALVPEDRYAQMGNVYFVPTLSCCINWLKKAKFKKIEILSDIISSTQEQRVTNWSTAMSLENYLDPEDSSKTIEGHPAPRRFLIKAYA